MQFQRIRFWSLCLQRADYYGWRWCLHIGPVLIWFGKGIEEC